MAKNPSTEDVRETLKQLATPGITPKELLKGVKKAHPKASKKDILHAAFASILEVAGSDPDQAAQLQDFAITHRGSGE